MKQGEDINQVNSELNILLADDDHDDCFLFLEALKDLPLQVKLNIAYDGDELMQLLEKNTSIHFHLLFLDLNMPRKDGLTCLDEIKQNEKLKHLPVIIFSTSFDKNVAEQLYTSGAFRYIRKPSEFVQLKKIIHHAIVFTAREDPSPLSKDEFLLSDL